MNTNKLTAEEANAILAIKGGADIYDYGLALTLRGIQRRGLPVVDYKTDPNAERVPGALFDITEPKTYKGDGADRVPYFGAIATRDGVKAARAALRGGV